MKHTFEKISNFRELGGYPTSSGIVKYGMLYRSGELGKATIKDIEKFKSLNISYVVDLREEKEIQKLPDFKLDTFTYFSYPVEYEKPEEYATIEKRTLKDFKKATKEEALHFEEMFSNVYAKSIYHNQAFKAVFDLLDQDKPILFHCVMGKDRTGVMAALLLLLFGCDKEIIIHDYLKSNHYYRLQNTLGKIMVFLKTRNLYAVREFKAFICPHKRNLLSIFQEIEDNYPTIDDFFLKEYGITNKRKEKWIQSYMI